MADSIVRGGTWVSVRVARAGSVAERDTARPSLRHDCRFHRLPTPMRAPPAPSPNALLAAEARFC